VMRKGRSVVVQSAPAAPRDTGRPRDDQRGPHSGPRGGLIGGTRSGPISGPISRDAREGDRGFDHSGRDVFDARDDRERDSVAQDPLAVQGAPEPFAPFDEFESSFGEFESASDASGIAIPSVDADRVDRTDRFERTSTLRTNRSAGARVERGTRNQTGDHFERSSEIRANRGTRATRESADRFQRSTEARDKVQSDGASSSRSAAAGEPQRPGRTLKGRALGYLSRREYSRAELSRKLMPFTEDADALEALLDSLVREGWLSDARFAESVIHRRAARLGATRIVSELKRHAVGETLIEEVNAQLRETELARARAVWRKKYGQLPESPAERARQARFLAARGFSMSIIGKILKGIDDDWTEN
jgi:regulatory protein